jgi:hypothetical protein
MGAAQAQRAPEQRLQVEPGVGAEAGDAQLERLAQALGHGPAVDEQLLQWVARIGVGALQVIAPLLGAGSSDGSLPSAWATASHGSGRCMGIPPEVLL